MKKKLFAAGFAALILMSNINIAMASDLSSADSNLTDTTASDTVSEITEDASDTMTALDELHEANQKVVQAAEETGERVAQDNADIVDDVNDLFVSLSKIPGQVRTAATNIEAAGQEANASETSEAESKSTSSSKSSSSVSRAASSETEEETETEEIEETETEIEEENVPLSGNDSATDDVSLESTSISNSSNVGKAAGVVVVFIVFCLLDMGFRKLFRTK